MKSQIKLAKIRGIFDRLGMDSSKLSDESMVERKQLTLEPSDSETCLAIISTPSVDSDGDMVMPEGIDFSIFQKNPVVFFQHNYADLPVGKIEALEVTDQGVQAKIRIATITDMGRDIWALIKDGYLKACSIGFIVTDYIDQSSSNFKSMLAMIGEKYGVSTEGCTRIITSCTMYENSIVGLPANKDALISAVTSKGLSKATIKAMGLELKEDKPNLTQEAAPVTPEAIKVEEPLPVVTPVIETPVSQPEVAEVHEVSKEAPQVVAIVEEVKPIIEEPAVERFFEILDHIATEEEVLVQVEVEAKNLKAKLSGKIFV